MAQSRPCESGGSGDSGDSQSTNRPSVDEWELLGMYEVGPVLGGGVDGTVRRGRLRQRQPGQADVAIKLIPRAKLGRRVYRELRSQALLEHPHVLRLQNVFLTPSHVAIVLELCEGGSLHDFVRSWWVSEETARKLFQQVMFALEYCHSLGVFNRDIKLENVLLDKARKNIKLADFGFAKTVDDSWCRSTVGSPNYTAPEVIADRPEEQPYDGRKADVWSCGALLYVLLFRKYPFEREEDKGLQSRDAQMARMRRNRTAEYELPAEHELSPECTDLLQKLLSLDPARRPSAQEAMQHAWLSRDLPPECERFNEARRRNCRFPTLESRQRLEERIREVLHRAVPAPAPTLARRVSRGVGIVMRRVPTITIVTRRSE